MVSWEVAWCVGLLCPTRVGKAVAQRERVHFEGRWRKPRKRRRIVKVSSPGTTDVILEATSFETSFPRDEYMNENFVK